MLDRGVFILEPIGSPLESCAHFDQKVAFSI